MSDTILKIDGLVKRFGGLIATDHLTLDVTRGELHAIIGPNGAGKTTLISQLSGEQKPDEGRINFDGHDITAFPTYRVSSTGLARSFQVTSVFPNLTALQNVCMAVQAHTGHSFSFWKNALKDTRLSIPAQEALERVGLGSRATIRAADLSHGEQRQLEIAMALATKPTMLLLDEPMAGMGAEESARMVDIIREFKKEYTILLIEHDMDAVFALADRITVLVYGRAIATGLPDDIRRNAEVRRAYLGDH